MELNDLILPRPTAAEVEKEREEMFWEWAEGAQGQGETYAEWVERELAERRVRERKEREYGTAL